MILKYILWSLFLSLVFNLKTIQSFQCKINGTRPVKTYIIDLDSPPKDRYKQPAADFKDGIAALIDAQKKVWNFPAYVIKIVETIASKIDDYFPYPFNEEIRGIAEASNSNVGDIVFANLIYDITAFCTSIVASQADGRLIHGRNLDYEFPELLQNLTFMAKYYRNGTLLFTSAQFSGFIGILSGHKYKKFTFSIDERDQGEWYINFLFALLDKSASPLSFLTRRLMENSTSFNDAVNMLAASDLIAPAYFILGGTEPDDGIVITRDQDSAINLWKLDTKNSIWYLLETNYDHWVPPPPNDDRRDPGMKAMNETTRANINMKTLLDVLEIEPVCNKETVYTAIMSASLEEDDGFKLVIH